MAIHHTFVLLLVLLLLVDGSDLKKVKYFVFCEYSRNFAIVQQLKEKAEGRSNNLQLLSSGQFFL
jgi:hypothetical protein